MKRFIFCLLIWNIIKAIQSFTWLPKEVALWAIEEFERLEEIRYQISFRGPDLRSSAPFITGNTFREYCLHICDDHNRCKMTPEDVQDGQCVFVKSDFFQFVASDVVSRIKGKYVLISHNGDLSTPDGQSDAKIGMKSYVASDILNTEYESGRLLAHHGQNLWWANNTVSKKSSWMHCLPIGFENREYPIGKYPEVYVEALKRNVINRPSYSIEEEKSKFPLLLVAFYPKSRIPDRLKVLKYLGAAPPPGQPKPQNPFYNETDLSHTEWLDAIVYHRFVLAPFGHGLDTHRISEILLMGGIPVMRKSTISSCYDDSDNEINGKSRGSLPVVILDSWNDLTAERLELEWNRITKYPRDHWDWRRLFIYHWLDRIGVSFT